MKNVLFFGMLALSTTLMATVSEQDFEHITAVVKTSNLKEVENLLALHILSTDQKKSLLEKATTTLVEKKQHIRLLNNPRNSVKAIVTGTLLVTFGSLLGPFQAASILSQGKAEDFKSALKELRENLLTKGNYNLQLSYIFIPLGLGAGIYLINKGLSYTTTVAVCNDAEKIRELIEQAQVD